MPSVHADIDAPWSDGATVHLAAVALPWRDGTTVHSLGGAYTPGSPPVGGTPSVPVPATVLTIEPRATYNVVHTVAVTDTRDATSLGPVDVSIATDEDSVFWTLRGSGPGALYSKLTTGVQPAQVEVNIDGIVWAFAIDSVSRSREFGSESVSFSGRSITVAASLPYQLESNWVNDGVTTAAQTAAIANIYTGLQIVWELDDWLIPDRVFTYAGTPLGVVKRLAETVGAVVRSDRSQFLVTVSPRYPKLPNEWSTSPPDVQIALDAVESESFERTDRPEYDGIYLSGQQSGVFGYVRLAGTAGATLHPLVTDLLLTDAPALRQRGMAVLGASGGQARMTLTLPVLTGVNEPGVLDLNQLVRVVDPAGVWFGLVRSVSVSASLPAVRQTVTLERHTKLMTGTIIVPPPPPASIIYVLDTFTGGGTTPITSHVGEVGATWTHNSFYYDGGAPTLEVSGGALRSTGSTSNMAVASGLIATPSNFYASLRLKYLSDSGGSSNIYLRYVDAAAAAGGTFPSDYLGISSAGDISLLATDGGGGSTTFVAGVEYTIRVELAEGLFSVFVDDVFLTEYAGGGYAGDTHVILVTGTRFEVSTIEIGHVPPPL